MLKNEKIKNKDNKEVMESLKQILEESLEWWHENLGFQDSLELKDIFDKQKALRKKRGDEEKDE